MALLTKKELPFRNDKDLAGLVTSWAAVTRVRQRMARNNNRIINGWRWAPGQKSPTCGLHRIYRSPLSSCTNLRPMGLRRWAEPAFLFVIDNGALPPPPPSFRRPATNDFFPPISPKDLGSWSSLFFRTLSSCSFLFFAVLFFLFSIFDIRECRVICIFESIKSTNRARMLLRGEIFIWCFPFFFFTNSIKRRIEYRRMEEGRGKNSFRFVPFRFVSFWKSVFSLYIYELRLFERFIKPGVSENAVNYTRFGEEGVESGKGKRKKI